MGFIDRFFGGVGRDDNGAVPGTVVVGNTAGDHHLPDRIVVLDGFNTPVQVGCRVFVNGVVTVVTGVVALYDYHKHDFQVMVSFGDDAGIRRDCQLKDSGLYTDYVMVEDIRVLCDEDGVTDCFGRLTVVGDLVMGLRYGTGVAEVVHTGDTAGWVPGVGVIRDNGDSAGVSTARFGCFLNLAGAAGFRDVTFDYDSVAVGDVLVLSGS